MLCTIDAMFERCHTEPNTGCWLWGGALHQGGYGSVRDAASGNALRRTHQVMYQLAHGPLPVGHVVMHRCDVRACINPDHLIGGTVADNNRDMFAKGRGRVASGEEQHMAKLTIAAVEEMRRLPRPVTRAVREALAKSHGVGLSTIDAAMYGYRWNGVAVSAPPTGRSRRVRR